MSRFYRLCSLALLVFVLSACGGITQVIVPTETVTLPADTPTIAPTDTAVPTNTLEATATPAATDTPTPSIPIYLTSVPGISLTLTAVYSTPGALNTLTAQQTMAAATEGAALVGFSGNLLKQCPNPSDAPKASWLDIPVMPQATAGQVVETLIGSYYCFRAPVTVAEVESFYKEKLTAPNWMLTAEADGTMQFVGLSSSGMQILFVLFQPGKNNDVLVAINATRPMSIPTQKP